MKIIKEALIPERAYMLRRGGQLILLRGDQHPYILGWQAQGENLKATITNYIAECAQELPWYYKNTESEKTKVLISKINSIYKELGYKEFKSIPLVELNDNEINNDTLINYARLVDDCLNQEFTRVRTSDPFYGGEGSHDIYFRISSKGYNWFNDIWECVYKNKNWITSVTVVKDSIKAAKEDNKEEVFYKHNGEEIDRMSVEDFINLSGRPVMENYSTILEKSLSAGNLLLESFPGTGAVNIHRFYSALKENYEI